MKNELYIKACDNLIEKGWGLHSAKWVHPDFGWSYPDAWVSQNPHLYITDYYQTDRDAIDGRDPWDDEELAATIERVNSSYSPMSWLEPAKCECGAETAKTTHASWCPKFKEYK